MVFRAGDTNSVKNLGQVVGDETVSGPLGEDTDGQLEQRVRPVLHQNLKDAYDDPHASAVTGSAEQVEPADASSLSLKSKGLLDFIVFEVNQWVVGVTISMILGKDGLGLVITSTVDQPTWGFWQEPL